MAALATACAGLQLGVTQHFHQSSTRSSVNSVKRSVHVRESKRLSTFRTMATIVSPTASLVLRPPPYELDALEPFMSKATLEFHWGKHHKAYYDNLKNQVEGTDLGGSSLEEIVKVSYNNGSPTPVFNNAGQAWNHDFFWQSMKPDGGGTPTGRLKELIDRDFGSYENFVKEFTQAGATQFGSGWAWLVCKDDKLIVEKTPNAVTPLLWGHTPLLTMDVWEHAYYLDFQNRRVDYIATFIEKLIAWDTVTAHLEQAKTLEPSAA